MVLAAKAEAALSGKTPDEATFAAAIRAELADARPLSGNGFKIGLVERTATALLASLAGEGK